MDDFAVRFNRQTVFFSISKKFHIQSEDYFTLIIPLEFIFFTFKFDIKSCEAGKRCMIQAYCLMKVGNTFIVEEYNYFMCK